MSSIRLKHASGNSMSLAAPGTNPASNLELKLPHTIGSANQLLKVDGSGQLGWATDNSGVSLSGSTNNTIATVTGANALAGEANFTFDGDTAAITRSANTAAGFSISNTNNSQGSAIAQLELSGGDNAHARLQFECNGIYNTIRSDGSGNLKFFKGSDERLQITSAGRVGIGVATPGCKLNIKADGSASDGLQVTSSGHSSYVWQIQNNDNLFNGSLAGELGIRGSSGISFSANAGSSTHFRITSGGQVRLPVNGQELAWGASQQFRMFWENSESRQYLKCNGAYGLAFRVNNGNRIEINGNSGDVTMQGASGRNFNWDNSDASLYLTDSNSGSSARLKIGTGGDLQLYHDVSGTNHITCANNHELKISANKLRVYDYTGGTEYLTVQSDKVMVHKDLKASTNNSLDIGANGSKFRRVFSTYFVHRTGSSSGVGVNEAEAIYFSGGLHFFHDNVTLSTSNFTHGITNNRSYDCIRLRNSGSGSAIYAESGSISSGSDYRMKENVEPITGAIDAVKKLKPCTYNIRKSFNEHDAGGTHQGFIAHEVQEAIPNIANIVKGTKDAMEEVRYMEEDENIPSGKKPGDGTGVFTDNPDYQGIDYGHMTPILAAALKEAITKIETLETKVAALEAG